MELFLLKSVIDSCEYAFLFAQTVLVGSNPCMLLTFRYSEQ